MSITRDASTALAVLVLAVLGLPAGTAAAAESYDNCNQFIDSLPAMITTQGVWCLRADLATTMNYSGAIAIDVQTNNVTVDCNGFKVGGLGAGVDTLTTGIGTTTSRMNTTVRNCNIRGFARGISLETNGAGYLVEDNRLENNRVVGILVSGDGSIIRGNRVVGTGGSSTATPSVGILAGFNVDVLDNLVSEVASKAGSNRDAIGIRATGNDSGSISGNRVRAVDADGTGVGLGIRIDSASRVSIRGNEVAAGAVPIDLAINCFDTQVSARDNTISGYVSAISGCSNDGNNVSK